MSNNRKIALYIDKNDIYEDDTATLSLSEDVLYDNVAPFFTVNALCATSMSCKGLYLLFQSPRKKEKEGFLLLQHVIKREINGVEVLLKTLKLTNSNEYWQAILKESKGSEGHVRKWQSISALKFATWAGDIVLLDILLLHIPTTHNHLALRQLQEVRKSGTEHGECLSPLLAMLKKYDTYDCNLDDWNDQQRDDYLVNEIGKEQLNMTMSIFHWFGWKASQVSNSGLGSRFALHRRSGQCYEVSTGVARGLAVDMVELRELYKSTIEEIDKRILFLEQTQEVAMKIQN